MPVGRPSDYNEIEVRTKLYTYLESCKDTEYPILDKEGNVVDFKVRANIPTIEGFALFLGVNKTTIYEWESNHPEFSNDIGRLRQEQANRLVNKGLSGEYNSTIAKVLLTKHGYREGIEQTGKDGGAVAVDITDPKALALGKEYEEKLKGNL